MKGPSTVTREDALLRRAKRYDEEALGALYDEYAPLIYAYIYQRVGDGRLAVDGGTAFLDRRRAQSAGPVARQRIEGVAAHKAQLILQHVPRESKGATSRGHSLTLAGALGLGAATNCRNWE